MNGIRKMGRMNSRDNILAAIRAGMPNVLPLPTFSFAGGSDNVIDEFITTLTSIGGQCKKVNSYETLNQHVHGLKQAGKFVIQCISQVESCNESEYKNAAATEIHNVDTVFLRGDIGIAENGAIWIPETNLVNRLLPFICQHLVLLVKEDHILPTMHEGYATIQVEENGFGVFIAGPSKTADIEQSLVIGAHGPLSLMVYLLS